MEVIFPVSFSHCKVNVGSTIIAFVSPKVLISFLFLHKNVCCGYSLEVPQRGTSDEYPQHTFLWRNKEYLLDTHSYLNLCTIQIAFLCPATRKVAGYYVIPSEILSVRPSVSVRPSAPPPFVCPQLLIQF